MKKTVNVNIGGLPFTVDEDAYNTLKDYLNEIEIRIGEDSKEVLEDVETRIADIFSENISPRIQVVSLELVKRAITIIGSAREFGEPVRPTIQEAGNRPACESQQSKKLYRSRDAMIGGVCAGIAEFFDIDVTLVRVITLCLLIFGGLSLWVYIILWIVIPRKPFSISEAEQDMRHSHKK